MKLSCSNIAWPAEKDEEMYACLADKGFQGVEIAPTRLFPQNPYDKLGPAKQFSGRLQEKFKLSIPSMQSIWFGLAESIFASDAERQMLLAHSKKAIDFAHAIHCPSLVFGCPQNRRVPEDMLDGDYLSIASAFFAQIGDYAASRGTCLAIEPVPTIYNTNFINTTAQAFALCKKLNNPGIKVNLDIGAMLYNGESIQQLEGNMHLVNHIHISEPYLAPIQKRALHHELHALLQSENYDRFLSIEMKNPGDNNLVKEAILYCKEVFCAVS